MDETIGQSYPKGLHIAAVSLLPAQEVYGNDSKTFKYIGPRFKKLRNSLWSLHGLLETEDELRVA